LTARILNADVFDALPTLAPGSVDCVVTSPLDYRVYNGAMPNFIPLPVAEIIRLYQDGKSSADIAAIYNVSPVKILRLLRKAGCVIRKPAEADRAARAGGTKKATSFWKGKKQPADMVERRARKIRGANHYLWKGGHSRRPYRKLVKKEKCDRCGSVKNLGIHHRDDDHYNDDLKNLVVLCLRCHMSVHKTAYWKAWREGKPTPKSNGPVGWLRREKE